MNKTGIKPVALAGREKMLVKAIVLLVGISVAMVYSLGLSLAQRPVDPSRGQNQKGYDQQITDNAQRMMEQGRQIFRYDTFGDEAYWTDKLKLHHAIQGSKFGGVGPGVSPKTALAPALLKSRSRLTSLPILATKSTKRLRKTAICLCFLWLKTFFEASHFNSSLTCLIDL